MQHAAYEGDVWLRPDDFVGYRLGSETDREDGFKTRAAAKREIYEESGIRDLELIRELGSYERYKIGVNGGDDPSELKAITMFLFRTSEKSLRPVDAENPEAKWVEKAKVALLLTHEKDKEFFRGVERILSK